MTLDNICSRYGLVLLCNKPLPELSQFYGGLTRKGEKAIERAVCKKVKKNPDNSGNLLLDRQKIIHP